jgi:hypothetical protein
VSSFIEESDRILKSPLALGPRGLLLLATLLLVPALVSPLWRLTMFAPQYQEGLRLDIYSYKLEGGNHGQDVKEINLLNHYIGMKDLAAEDFTEFLWLPFALGTFGLLFLRTVVLGTLGHLVDVTVLFVYFAGFSLWSFAHKLWWYGHHLDPTAAVKVPPFMPPLLGGKQLANFEVYSYPALASYTLGGAFLALLLSLFLSWRAARRAGRVAGAGPG